MKTTKVLCLGFSSEHHKKLRSNTKEKRKYDSECQTLFIHRMKQAFIEKQQHLTPLWGKACEEVGLRPSCCKTEAEEPPALLIFMQDLEEEFSSYQKDGEAATTPKIKNEYQKQRTSAH